MQDCRTISVSLIKVFFETSNLKKTKLKVLYQCCSNFYVQIKGQLHLPELMPTSISRTERKINIVSDGEIRTASSVNECTLCNHKLALISLTFLDNRGHHVKTCSYPFG